jgi:hypothetical protein
MASVNAQQILSPGVFEREFVEAAGLAERNGVTTTHSQRVRVSIHASASKTASDSERLDLVVSFELLGEASYNVVSHEAFREAVAKRLTRIVAKAQQATHARKTDSTTGMNRWSIRFFGVQSTKETAWQVGSAARDIIHAIE